MRIEFGPEKEAINQRQHHLSLALAERFDWRTARYRQARTVGGELRWQVFADLDGQSMTAIYTLRGLTLRIISLRRASRKERRRDAR